MCQKYQQKRMYWHSNMKPVHSEASPSLKAKFKHLIQETHIYRTNE